MSALNKAIKACKNQTGLASALGLSPMTITHWKRRGVPPKRCRAIERATKRAVTRYELRPDIYGPAPKKAA